MPQTPSRRDHGRPGWCQPGERLNLWSHLAALPACLLASAALVYETAVAGEARKIAAALVFGLALVALYGASALFHGCTGTRKQAWQRADHACIYLLIAGSHTPFALAGPPVAWSWPLLALVWGLALWGGLRALRTNAPPMLGLYIALGWLSLLGAAPAATHHGAVTLAWLLAGGLLYSAGTAFYRQLARLRHAHGIWHLFVVAGTACHIVAVSCLLT